MASLAWVILRTHSQLAWSRLGYLLLLLSEGCLACIWKIEGKKTHLHFLWFLLSPLLWEFQPALTLTFEPVPPVFRKAVCLCAQGQMQRNTVPKHSKQCKGMKPLIKCKNKTAWHCALFWKRFLNYRVQHLCFCLSVAWSLIANAVYTQQTIDFPPSAGTTADFSESPWPSKIPQNHLLHKLLKFYRHLVLFWIGHIYTNKIKWRIRIIWIVHAREGFALNYPGNCLDSPFYFVKVDMALESLS